ncbi:MAG: hypothetical protein ABIG03_03590 [Candidatus Eisenbacteria bacterium]
MRRLSPAIAAAALTVALVSAPASAGIVDVAVGVYGGANFPMEGGAGAGTVLGAKLRVLPPIPMIGAEVYYQRVGQNDAEDVWNDGDVRVNFSGEGFDVFGADLLIGGVRGLPGFKWYGIAGINFVEFSESGSGEYRMGGELGVGLEIVPPALGLSVEGRALIAYLGVGDEPDPKMATVTVGVNYYF